MEFFDREDDDRPISRDNEIILDKYSVPYTPGSGINFGEYCKAEMLRSGLESGITLSWSKLTYTVMQPPATSTAGTMLGNAKKLLQFWKRPKPVPFHLLNSVSGYIKPGMLVLLLGPPGSGKTTLLETLAGRKSTSASKTLSGELLINGRSWTPDFNRIAGYVAQDDYHIPLLTVRETLTFSSMLRNPESLSKEKKLERVDVALDVLGISHVQNTVVGGELLRGVSGGERKRVSIGVEIVTCPSVLFLDEPTTGLDSAAAYDVIKSLRLVADAGIPVICSLLQPSQELYNLFDTLCLMDKRECAYYGPTSQCLDHFEQAGFSCPKNKNVAEFLLDICTNDGEQYQNAHKVPNQSLAENFKQSDIYQDLGIKLFQGIIPPDPAKTILPSKRIFASSVGAQLATCIRRNGTIFFRNRRVIIARIIRSLIVGFLIGTLFWQMPNTQIGANNRISLVFFCITFTAMGAIASLPQVVEERRIFYHQRAAHFYRTIAHFFSSLVLDVPLTILEGFMFTTIVFWATGMNSSEWDVALAQYMTFFVVLMVTNLCAKQFCRLCAAITPTLGTASALAPAILCVWLVFGGFLIPRTSIPMYYAPLNLLSPFRYTLESLSITALSGLTVECAPSEFVPPQPEPTNFCTNLGSDECECDYSSGYCDDPAGLCGCQRICPVESGMAILEQYGLNTKASYVPLDTGLLFLFYFVFCGMTFLALDMINWNESTGSGPSKDPNHKTMQEGNVIEYMRGDDDQELEFPSVGPSSGVGSINRGGDGSGVPLFSDSTQSMGASLVFSRLCYSVVISGGLKAKITRKVQWKQLLFDVYGYAPSGRMIALMGATGAGKTTLLDVLAQRKTGGEMKGHMIVNGNFKDKYYNRLVGYVEQSNVFLPTLTVRETLQFSALMRLKAEIPKTEKLRRVEDVIDQLYLRHVADRLVGHPDAGGLSMELRKKLSIAAELVAEPSIFFLDEPTSGLDSQAAAAVMETARIVANTGVPVICTIHQPSQDLFYLFDWLLLLRPGGQTIYFGPLGEKGRTVLDFFGRHGVYCPESKNPAEFVIECSGAGIGNSRDAEDSDVGFNIPEDFDCDSAWLNSQEYQSLTERMDEMVREATQNEHRASSNEISPTGFTSPYSASLLAQIALTVRRSFMNKYRQPTVIRSYFVMYIVMALLLGSLYFNLPTDQSGARNRVALIYFCIVFSALGAISAIPGVIQQRDVYYREKPSFLRPFAYFLAQVLAEIPLILVSVTIFGLIVYYACGLNRMYLWQMPTFVSIYLLACFTCTAFAMMVSSAVATAEVANTIVGVSSSIFSLFAGFIIPKDSIPNYWIWLHYLSYYKYPLEALSINEMHGLTFNCTTDEYAYILVNESYQSYCPINDGPAFLSHYFSMHTTYSYVGIDVAASFSYLIAFIFLTYCCIKWINHLKR